MKTLAIKADKKYAKDSAIVILAVCFLLSALLIAASIQGFTSSGLIEFLLFFTLIFWLMSYLFCTSIRFLKISQFQGPLLSINENGIIDHLHGGNVLTWDDIQFCEWKTESGKGGPFRHLKIVPKQRSFKTRLLALIGLHGIRYPETHLSTSTREISEFMLSVIPKDILR